MEVNHFAHAWERIRVQVDSGAIDTVAPKHVAKAFSLMETKMSKKGIGFIAANGSEMKNHGEKKGRRVHGRRRGGGDEDDVRGRAEGVGLGAQDEQGGSKVVLDGEKSYVENTKTRQKTKIHYEAGQYVLYLWVPAAASEMGDMRRKASETSNRYAILAADEPQGFHRRVKA